MDCWVREFVRVLSQDFFWLLALVGIYIGTSWVKVSERVGECLTWKGWKLRTWSWVSPGGRDMGMAGWSGWVKVVDVVGVVVDVIVLLVVCTMSAGYLFGRGNARLRVMRFLV